MKKLVTTIILFSLTFNSSAFAQHDQAEIRLLIAEAPVIEAMKKAKEADGMIVWYWLIALAYSGASAQAFQVAHQLKAWMSAKESAFAIALGLAIIGKTDEASALLRSFNKDDEEQTVQREIVDLMAMAGEIPALLAEAQKIADLQDRDEALIKAVETIASQNRLDQMRQLVAHISTEQGQKKALQLIQAEEQSAPEEDSPMREELKFRPIESLTVDELLMLEKVEAAISKAKRIAAEDDRNDSFVSISEHLAQKHNYRQARLIANLCTDPLLRLSADTHILSEFAVQQNPILRKKLRQ